MKKKILIGVGLIVLIMLLIGLNLYLNALQPARSVQVDLLETMVVQGETIQDRLIASGQVEPQAYEEVYYDPSLGDVVEIMVEVGEEIEAGTPLFRYESLDVARQRQQLELQERRLSLQMEDLRQQKKDLEQEIDRTRKRLEQAQGDVNLLEREQLETQLKQLKQEQEQLALSEKLLQLDGEEQKLQRDSVKQEEERLVVKSRLAGRVVKVDEAALQRSGVESQPLIIIASMDQYVVRGTLTEYDAVHIQPGQAALIRPKVDQDEVWEGEVTQVEFIPSADTQGLGGLGSEAQITYYPFEVKVTEEKPGLKHGFHVTVELLTAVREEAILLPFPAFIQQDEEEYIYVLNEGQLERRQVSTGWVTEDGKEVVSGLSLGETVVLNPSADWGDGMEVMSDDSID